MGSKTAVLFPGQGTLKAGMVADLAAQSAVFAEAEGVLGWSLVDETIDFTDTAVQQPALFVASMARWQMWRDEGNTAAYVAGHSMGEITALCTAGSVSFEQGLRLVARRGMLMKAVGEQRPGRMAAILKLSIEEVETICQQVQDGTGLLVTIANDNCPSQLVVAGDEKAVEQAMALARIQGGRAKLLAVRVASHCAWMAEIEDVFGMAVRSIAFRAPDLPVVGNVTAEPLTTPAAIQEELIAQLTHRVRWTESMRWLIGQGVGQVVDVGPGKVVAGLMKRIDADVERVVLDG